MSFGYKPGTYTGKGLRRPDNKVSIISQAVGKFIEKLLPILKGKVDGDVSAENDIEFSQGSERMHEIEFAKVDHRSDFIFDLP